MREEFETYTFETERFADNLINNIDEVVGALMRLRETATDLKDRSCHLRSCVTDDEMAFMFTQLREEHENVAATINQIKGVINNDL